jgi:hypothetical protein
MKEDRKLICEMSYGVKKSAKIASMISTRTISPPMIETLLRRKRRQTSWK